MKRFLIVGAGEIAAVHRKALDRHESACVAGVVDIVPGGANRIGAPAVREYRTAAEAVRDCVPDWVVVATPTPSHREVCEELLGLPGSFGVLAEKPLASELRDVHRLHSRALASGHRLVTALHFAFAPEVRWARTALAERGLLGRLSGFQSWFLDPYGADRGKAEIYASSWLDSGINALSVIDRFARPEAMVRQTSLPGESSVSTEVSFVADGPTRSGTIFTSWNAAHSSKTTRLVFGDDADVVLDHTAMVGILSEGGTVADVFGEAPGRIRLLTHYDALYGELLTGNWDAFELSGSLRLHDVLFGSAELLQ